MERVYYIQLEKEVYEALEKEAQELGCTVEKLANDIIREWLDDLPRRRASDERIKQKLQELNL